MRYLAGFGRFWWDFIIGEDWKIAAGTVAVLAAGGALIAGTGLPDSVLTVAVGAAIVTVVAVSIVAAARGRR